MRLPEVDYTILDEIIVGRVQPHIYAFSTNTVPNYLKVGDTFRPVATRLREWQRYFPDLIKMHEEPATVADDVYFRDFAVHRYLEADLGKTRLASDVLGGGIYYSREFFGDTSANDVECAIADIRSNHEGNTGRYDYYDATRRLPVEYQYVRGPAWTLRPNQQAAVDRFTEAIHAGRTNLLMYAVMRFGKSFTSLCCAEAIAAQVVLVVSAKADVKTEWKKTVETAGNFAGYTFLDSEDLNGDPNAVRTAVGPGRGVVLFLTLQDLQGSKIKGKHERLFENELDLLIIDETHFGARAGEYGRVLRNAGQPTDDRNALTRGEDDLVDAADAEEQLKVLKARVRLHLSGTPYRILMGSEFSKEDVISFVQFSDIVRDQEQWDRRNQEQDEPGDEWENPYFGFPQMIRFAFKPSRSARVKMEQLRIAGSPFALSALLEPASIKQDQHGLHKQFKHQPEVLELLKAVDGSQQDESLLSFLDYDRIKDGMMCRHIVMVLPYCASCDAMEQLIAMNRSDFRNLGDYEVINISGVEGAKRYRRPEEVKQAIRAAEADGRKTLTLTVNRMLTGSTVEQWDTMLYLKDTSSPQEYDQAVFRLQNQYVRTLLPNDEAANASPIRENLKPQTLLVDFDPDRLFRMQEQKSLIYSVNSEVNGNATLAKRIEQELRISPIITMNLGRIHRVEAANILEAVSEYNSQRSIADEARDIPIDLTVLTNQEIRRVIEAQSEIGSKAGLTLEAVEGDDDDIEVPQLEEPDANSNSGNDSRDKGTNYDRSGDLSKILARKLQMYYQRILFFAMLAPTHVRSLSDVVDAIGDDDVCARIARHLALDSDILRALLGALDPFKLNSLDYKIQNVSQLVRDETLEPLERATRALNKFNRISDSEVRTPQWLCRDMVAQIPGDALVAAINRGEPLLDLASKSGEFALALYERLVGELGVEPGALRELIYSVPTSTIAYEFTRLFYDILGLDASNIAGRFSAYVLIDAYLRLGAEDLSSRLCRVGVPFDALDLDSGQTKGSEEMKFGAVVGNPPYQEADNDGGKGSAKPLYHQFVSLAMDLSPEFISMVTPSVWFTGGKRLDNFRRGMLHNENLASVHHFSTAQEVFPQVELRGGVNYFLLDRNYDNRTDGVMATTTQDGVVISQGRRKAQVGSLEYFIADNVAALLIDRLLADGHIVSNDDSELMLSHFVSSRNPYGFLTTFADSQDFRADAAGLHQPIKIYASKGKTGFVERASVGKHAQWIDRWKVLTPFANNIGTSRPDDNMNTLTAGPGTISTETYLVVGADLDLAEESCRNLEKYMHTRFLRFLVSFAKANQNGTRKTFALVPMQDLSPESDIDWDAPVEGIDEQLNEKYGLSIAEREHIRLVIKEMLPGVRP
ncbi:Eco57I restriction-modification methylase domain-containing protein [Jatrophihabitans telluris]|uniref:Eco57I restriction-modification methylase domain-containing protein n=1 Tax=Jatrophihabitans telluris TaxID=2038343 RepID=A0ABY4QYW2_9ACTN|nr:Eco57I restriction-modification methylase domain-containing protein [Jatrophihabitans telluris]UQX88818.1 Eco57I restriction-modification methylase domain-containing protein [Jatrophihabitans telluris]